MAKKNGLAVQTTMERPFGKAVKGNVHPESLNGGRVGTLKVREHLGGSVGTTTPAPGQVAPPASAKPRAGAKSYPFGGKTRQ